MVKKNNKSIVETKKSILENSLNHDIFNEYRVNGKVYLIIENLIIDNIVSSYEKYKNYLKIYLDNINKCDNIEEMKPLYDKVYYSYFDLLELYLRYFASYTINKISIDHELHLKMKDTYRLFLYEGSNVMADKSKYYTIDYDFTNEFQYKKSFIENYLWR